MKKILSFIFILILTWGVLPSAGQAIPTLPDTDFCNGVDYCIDVTILNDGTKDADVIGCAYCDNITLNNNDCTKVAGTFTDYQVTQIPVCPETIGTVDIGALGIPANLATNISKELEKLLRGSTSSYLSIIQDVSAASCTINSAYWSPQNAFEGDSVTLTVETSPACNGMAVQFEIWEDIPFWPDALVTTIPGPPIASEKSSVTWTVTRPPSKPNDVIKYYFVVTVGPVQKESERLAVNPCKKDTLILCEHMAKSLIQSIIDWILGRGGSGGSIPEYVVIDTNKYMRLAVKEFPGLNQTEHWILERNSTIIANWKSCQNNSISKYTIVHKERYLNNVSASYGNEPLYKKFVSMYGHPYADYLYCYKTVLQGTQWCQGINREWYGFENNTLDAIDDNFINETRLWNYYQDIVEMPDKSLLDNPEYKTSKLFSDAWTKIFTTTPLLNDTRTYSEWTKIGAGTFFAGAGFDRYSTCGLGCDSREWNDRLPECGTDAGSKECSDCINNHCEANPTDCTTDTDCLGGPGDCFKPCKIVPRKYVLEALINESSFYGIPYNGTCPKGGFEPQNILVYNNTWGNPAPVSNTIERCILEGGVIGITTIQFPETIMEDCLRTPYIYIANSDQNTITKLSTADGSFVCKYPVGTNPSRTSVDLSGDVWIGNRDSASMTKVNGSKCGAGGVIGNYGVGNGPRGIGSDIDNSVWVGNYLDGNVWKLDSWGNCIFGNAVGCLNPAIVTGGNPYGAAVDGQGNVFVNILSAISKIRTSDGTLLLTKPVTGTTPYGIAVDSNGNVWTPLYGGGSVVKRKNSDLSIMCTGSLHGGNGRGIAVDADNSVWVADSTLNIVHKFSNSCKHLFDVNVGGGPIGVAVDSDNNVWVVNYNGGGPNCVGVCSPGSVTKVKTDGSVIGTYHLDGHPYTYSDMTGFGLWMVSNKVDVIDVSGNKKDFIFQGNNATKCKAISFNVTDTANMGFNITYLDLKRLAGNKYVLTRIYKPENPYEKFIVDSDFAIDYNLLPSASNFEINVTSNYTTMLRRDKYYVACRRL